MLRGPIGDEEILLHLRQNTGYRDGHWAWVDPWGWTWIDDAPWGFAVSHYGRWTNLSGTWGWVPGPVTTRAYYAPALVAFVGGNNFQLTISSGNVGGICSGCHARHGFPARRDPNQQRHGLR